MHPDTGAIIGIALAGSVLFMASLLLCILHLPCCKNASKIRTGNGNRRNIRPSSTSSHVAFANMELRGSRNIDELSAANLHHQNQTYICSATGIVNPMWQIRCTCHPSGMMTASQQSLNFAPCVSMNNHNHCQFHQPHAPPLSHLDHPSNTADSHSFQYYSPQVLSPADSPPPYPGTNQETDDPSHLRATTNASTNHPHAPPYSPKRNSVMI